MRGGPRSLLSLAVLSQSMLSLKALCGLGSAFAQGHAASSNQYLASTTFLFVESAARSFASQKTTWPALACAAPEACEATRATWVVIRGSSFGTSESSPEQQQLQFSWGPAAMSFSSMRNGRYVSKERCGKAAAWPCLCMTCSTYL